MFSEKEISFYLENNPYSTEVFKKVWAKIYSYEDRIYSFKSFYPLSFVKSKIPFTYLNIGKNLTSGIYYNINESEADFKKKVFFIRDIPSYYKLSDNKKYKSSLKFKSVKQYSGFLADIRDYTSVDNYLRTLVSSRRIRYYKKCLKKIDENRNFSCKVYHGHINKDNHHYIISCYRDLMKKRYNVKGERIIGDNMQSNSFFKKLSLALINDKKAMLKVLYNDKTPIGILFSYTSNKVVHGSRMVIDMEYSKYGIGHILLYKELQWAFNNNFAIVDYTKVEYPYKYKWCNHKYTFDFHFWYDGKYLPAVITAHILATFFWFLQQLRTYNLHTHLHKILFVLYKLKRVSK